MLRTTLGIAVAGFIVAMLPGHAQAEEASVSFADLCRVHGGHAGYWSIDAGDLERDRLFRSACT